MKATYDFYYSLDLLDQVLEKFHDAEAALHNGHKIVMTSVRLRNEYIKVGATQILTGGVLDARETRCNRADEKGEHELLWGLPQIREREGENI